MKLKWNYKVIIYLNQLILIYNLMGSMCSLSTTSHFSYSASLIEMKSKASRVFLKYFYYTNIISGFVLVDINQHEKSVKKSWPKIFYALLWTVFFMLNQVHAVDNAYNDFEDIYFKEKAVTSTIFVETFVTYGAILLISFISFIKLGSSIKLFNKLLQFSDENDYNLFDNNVGYQLACLAVFGELGVTFLYFGNLFWAYANGLKNMTNLNPFDNSILNCYLIVMPVSVVSRYSLFLSFSIDVIRNFIRSMNIKIEKSLKLTTNSEDFKELAKEIEDIDQLYKEASSSLKLFESNYGWVIVILQCLCLIVGVNQVSLKKIWKLPLNKFFKSFFTCTVHFR